MRKPLAVAENLDNLYSETNVIFSPDDKWIVTGLPGRKGTKGSIVFLNSETLVEERRVAIAEGTVVRVLWHSRINQASHIRLPDSVSSSPDPLVIRSSRQCQQEPFTCSTPHTHPYTVLSFLYRKCHVQHPEIHHTLPPTSNRSFSHPTHYQCTQTKVTGCHYIKRRKRRK